MAPLSTFETNLVPKITSTRSMIRTSTCFAIDFSLLVFFYPSFTRFTFLSFFIVIFDFIYSGNIFSFIYMLSRLILISGILPILFAIVGDIARCIESIK